MTLSFSQKIKNKPTLFVEKILTSIKDHELTVEMRNYLMSSYSEPGINILDLNPKIHTIRPDLKNRWKAGNKIHFAINNRTKNRIQFAPILFVNSVQKIRIENIFNDRNKVVVDNKILSKKEIEILSKNDGFDSVNDFWDFFSGEDFNGKIIHWTNHKY